MNLLKDIKELNAKRVNRSSWELTLSSLKKIIKSHAILLHYHVWKNNSVVICQIQGLWVFLEFVAVDQNELSPVFDLWRLALLFISVISNTLAVPSNSYHRVNLFQEEIACLLDFNDKWPFLDAIFLKVYNFINLSILSIIDKFLNFVSIIENLTFEIIEEDIYLPFDLWDIRQFLKIDLLGKCRSILCVNLICVHV